MSYTIRWVIDLEEPDPYLAALQCVQIQQDPASVAHVFEVIDSRTGEWTVVDLDRGGDTGRAGAPLGSLLGVPPARLRALAARYAAEDKTETE